MNYEQPCDDGAWVAQSLLLLDSYQAWLGRPLVARGGTEREQAERLFAAPQVVVSHGLEADPILNYGNRAALELFETDLALLLAMPSRLTAEPVHRDERARMLERTSRDGYIDDYRGIRVTTTGRRFLIPRATVWNVVDATGTRRGQAATFDRWEFL